MFPLVIMPSMLVQPPLSSCCCCCRRRLMMRQNAKLAVAREINLDGVAATSLFLAVQSIQSDSISNNFWSTRHLLSCLFVSSHFVQIIYRSFLYVMLQIPWPFLWCFHDRHRTMKMILMTVIKWPSHRDHRQRQSAHLDRVNSKWQRSAITDSLADEWPLMCGCMLQIPLLNLAVCNRLCNVFRNEGQPLMKSVYANL